MAFRTLYEHVVEDKRPDPQITFAPHVVMRGNLDFFLKRVAVESKAKAKAL
jgi:hypothetical protein